MKDKLKKEIISLLKGLRTDAKMALKGEWDVSTYEGLEGFECQIELINDMLFKLKHE